MQNKRNVICNLSGRSPRSQSSWITSCQSVTLHPVNKMLNAHDWLWLHELLLVFSPIFSLFKFSSCYYPSSSFSSYFNQNFMQNIFIHLNIRNMFVKYESIIPQKENRTCKLALISIQISFQKSKFPLATFPNPIPREFIVISCLMHQSLLH